MSSYGDPTQSISIGRLSKVVNGITHLQSPLDDSKQDHTLIRNSVTSDSTFRDEQHPSRENLKNEAQSPEERYQNCDELHQLSSRDDADLINDIMNQKSSDEDYDFKLVESMDEVDGDNMNNVRGVSPVMDASTSLNHPVRNASDDVRAARNNDANNTQISAEANFRKNPFHPPKLLMPHQIAAFEKKKQYDQHRVHSSINPKWNSGNPPRKNASSRYTSGEDGYFHDFNSGNLLPSSSSYSSLHPPIPSSETSPPTLSQSTIGSTGTQLSRKRQLTDTEECQPAGRLPTIINMKRSRNQDQEPIWNDNNNPRKPQGNSNVPSSFNEYDPYNSINHIQPHYTSSSQLSDNEIRRTWSTSSTASSLSAGGMSSTLSSTASFDHGQPDIVAACNNKSKNNNTYNGMVGMSGTSQCSGTTASYSKFDLLSIEDTSVISSRMFTANGKPFSTSPIMGAGSTSTVSSMAVEKKKESAGVNESVKPDPGVTPISKNTRRDREYSYHYNQGNKFSFSETPGPSSTSSYGFSNNNKKIVGGNGGRKDSQDHRQSSFTPIPMNPSDDIDDMHNMNIQHNLSWSIMGDHSPLGGESDGIDPWSSALKDSWSRGNTHDILSSLSPNSDAGIKSPCLAEFFDLPHPEERENLGKGAGHYHSYSTHHHPHQQSSHQGYTTNSQMGVAQPPHHFSHQDSHSTVNPMYGGGYGGRTPIKPNYHQDPNCLPANSMMRNHPPPTPVGNVWSSDHYGPPVMSNAYPTGIDQPGHPKAGRRTYPLQHGSYPVETRDDSNTSRDGGNYYPPPSMPNPYRPIARGGGSDRVINLRGRVPQVHHSRPHAPPPPHHYDGSSHHAAPIHPHQHQHPVAGRSQWVGRHGPPIGQHQPLHSHRHVPSSTRSIMAQPTSQHHSSGVDSIHSRRKCIPLKPPIPSKFQGDIEKFKDASVPEFTNLVNYPANIANKMAAMAGDGMKICVMCGAACPCSSIPKGKCKGGSEKEDGRGQVHHHKQPPNAHKLNGTASSGQGCYAIIPTQNKGLCTFCDVNVWVVLQTGLEIKWCKGCKNFRPWAAFGDKGLATKCVRCRDRQREKYAIQKEEKEKTRGDDSSVLAIEI